MSLSWLPHFHDMGLVDGIIQPLYSGFTGLLMSPAAFLQNPARWLQAITHYRVTHSGGPNFAYDLCVRRIDEAQRASLDLSSWSVAYNGAEPVRYETLERFVAAFAPYGFRRQAFYPAYGLAEAVLKVTGPRRDDGPVYRTVEAAALASDRVVPCEVDAPDARTLVGCGRTALETEVVIVNPESSSVCAPDEVGEIWVSGPGVAAGYWNCPEETERTFAAHLGGHRRGSFLRTGDLGFVLDGELFITGRLKDLIIIRGRNHYPQDVELAMQSAHAALKPNGGAAFSVEIEGEERLVVVHESERGAESAEIIEAVRTAIVEEFDIQPAAIVLIRSGTLPKTSSGKVRRAACREAFLSGSLRTIGEWRASAADDQTGVVQWLHQLLTQKLESPLVELDQPLARYGIDSLTALELKHAVETSLGVRLPLTSFLQNQTLADLTRVILASEPSPARVSAMDQPRKFPLSHGQQSLWAVQNVSPESIAYNVSFAARINGDLDLDALHRAFETLVQRHPLLRAKFPSRDGTPVCVIPETAEISLRVEDVAGELRDRLQQIAETSFDLENGPLLRAHLFRKSAHEHVLLLSAHHIIVDYWSLAILLHELGEVYESGAALALSASYSDYVRQQTELLAGGEGEQLREYWLRQLAGELPVIDLPTDRARPAVQSYRGASLSVRMDQQTTKQLQQLAVHHEATLFMTLLAAFQVLLYRYTGQKEILVGAPSSGRVAAEFADTVGYFVNPLVLRAKISGDLSFTQFLNETRQTVLAAFEHQEYPFDLLVKQLQPQRDPALSPLFQV
ncbi:MAG TPA: condensation domain-containing protein, partial [Pyrinomonadaceae bacterium]|nr:condensation domain-containing protein [Pyrinomonadaceae bacterium]